MGNKLYWAYQKNKHLVDALLLRRAPEFAYQARPRSLDGEVPVFTFHLALPDWFEEQCQHLAENNYTTLSAEAFLSIQTNSGAVAKNSILLTFDDGLKHVWSVAYPLLKKYGLRATCFIIPGCIPESDTRVRPTLEDVWNGTATHRDVMGIMKDEPALATWNEIKIMHESGVIDFQSHSMYHALVPVSNEITDFVRPGFDPYFYGNVYIPMYTVDGKDEVSRVPRLGMPVYASAPRMQVDARYFDDEGLMHHCIEMVDKQGSQAFFNDNDWRALMDEAVLDYRKKHTSAGRFESPEERDAAIFSELREAKHVIEERLPGKVVNQLCWPWYRAAPHAVAASRKAGYAVNYFGQCNGRVTNRPGQDPFAVVRLEEIFLQRLPGKGRMSIYQTLKKMFDLRSVPSRLFPEGRILVE